ncbi:glycosyltransferase [Myxococcus sp. CA051A]|uniref:spore coat polysaccharide biosynthesis glycosyltransferase ExoK n=1 Tax=unclassified Myxococcus TaxID=2648731 RepID=UPI00157B92AE|nr:MULTISPECIES: spore coat polysaccharide biosynthesis glycosyltransferase ExoK [unclassified Myxococcus]NTX14230.1 glycosyltransferase [Myxococcus sp. CA056]NTX35373.1 glycosyltransferase [Myxococcus sp. CA033]NTX56047.1 glycosyltransferase [Myxococcus sp. CA039A]NTX62212.1 glycosyltransferase [Myxococcus sp. CA051A]
MRREDVKMGARPLRLVQFTRSFHIGGTEVQVLELLRGLPPSYQLQVSVLEDAGPLMGAVWKLGYVAETFPLKGSVAQANTAYQVMRMARWLKTNRVDLVHVHDFYSTLIAVPAAKLAGTKVIVGRLDLSHWQGSARRAVHSRLTAMADHVVANAEAIRRMLVEEEGLPASRVSVIHNGLDLARFDARMREGLKSPLPDTGDAPVIVHVANMNHPVKRQEDLLLALAMLHHGGTPLHAFLVGDGPRRKSLEKLAAELGVSDTVHFLRHRTDVAAIYARATLGVLCSSAEGMSNAVMEGMAAGLPMVVTRVGGNTDLVRDGERGLVVPAERPAQLAQAFNQLLSSPEKAKRMGRAARDFVARELSLERLIRLHDALYQRVVHGP